MLVSLALSIASVLPHHEADAGTRRLTAVDTHIIAVVTPTRILTGYHCEGVEYGLTQHAGRTVANCLKLASNASQGSVAPGGGHVLRLSHAPDMVFLDCHLERAERFLRADGGYNHYLEFSCQDPPPAVLEPR
jgi:hypothetical protein